MIVLTAEMWPGGNQDAWYGIGSIEIINDGGKASDEYANYDVIFRDANEDRRVRVERYYRNNGYLGILRLALNKLHAGDYERD